MHGEIEGQVLSYPNGVCTRHNAALISMDGRPHCLRCGAEAARLERHPAGVNTAADPGHEAMKALLKEHIKEIVPSPDETTLGGPVVHKTLAPLVLTAAPDFKSHVAVAIDHLRKAPMPKDLAQFKAVQRAIATLEKITGEI